MGPLEHAWPDPDRRDAALIRLARRVIGGVAVKNGQLAYAPPQRERHRLSTDEWYALVAASHGLRRSEAAEVLGVYPETVANRLERARHILRAKNTTHAVAIAIRCGLIP